MLTLVEARNTQGALLSLPMDDISGGYSIEDIGGLGPVKATIVSASFAGQDGAQFQNSRREERNIILQLGLEPDYTTVSARDLRLNLYNFFMTKSRVDLRFYDSDDLVVNITGWIESCIPAIFSDQPGVEVSILCLDSDFVELDAIELEWETSSNTTDEIGKLLIPYLGTVETGIQLVMNVDRPMTEFTIYHQTPNDSLASTDIAASFINGDIITLNTVVGSKSLTLTRSGSVTSLLYAKSPQSGWVELVRGDNYIRVYTEGDPIPFTVIYTPRHGGL